MTRAEKRGWGLLHGRQEPAARSHLHSLLDNSLGYADLLPNDDLKNPEPTKSSITPYNLDLPCALLRTFSTLLATMRGNT